MSVIYDHDQDYCGDCGKHFSDCNCPPDRSCLECGAPEGECIHWDTIRGVVQDEDEVKF